MSLAEQQLQTQETAAAKQKKRLDKDAPIGIFRLIDRQPSGFILEGTENLPEPQQLEVAGARKIPTQSAYFVPKKGDEGGKDRIAIRYLASTPEIEVKKQEREGAIVNPNEDNVYILRGDITVVGEGKTEGLLKYMRKASWNLSNPDRGDVVPIWEEIFPEKEDESLNENTFALGDAIQYINGFILERVGDNYVYDEERLNAHAKLHNAYAGTPSGNIKALIAKAQINPVTFLEKSKRFDEELLLDILHAEKLNLINFGDTSVTYVGDNKIIGGTYSKHFSIDQKRQILAGHFVSAKGLADHAEFKAKLKMKKEEKADN